MKKIKLSLFLSFCMTVLYLPDLIAQGDDEDGYKSQVRKLRKVVASNDDGVDEDDDDDKEIFAQAVYMMAPEDNPKNNVVDHAIVAVLGQEEDDFWAADLVGDYSTFFKMLKSTFRTSIPFIRTTDTLEGRKSIFYGKDRKRAREFSNWPTHSWNITSDQSETIKRRVREQVSQPPLYNAFGINFNLLRQERIIVNSGMWAQSIFQPFYDGDETLAKLALKKSMYDDDFTVWLSGFEDKKLSLLAECLLYIPKVGLDVVRIVWLLNTKSNMKKAVYGVDLLESISDKLSMASKVVPGLFNVGHAVAYRHVNSKK